MVINSYVRLSDIEYYTIPRDLETEPKLPPRLCLPLHHFLLTTNLNLYWLAKELVTNKEWNALIQPENKIRVCRVIDCLISKDCKSQNLNEMRVMKVIKFKAMVLYYV